MFYLAVNAKIKYPYIDLFGFLLVFLNVCKKQKKKCVFFLATCLFERNFTIF